MIIVSIIVCIVYDEYASSIQKSLSEEGSFVVVYKRAFLKAEKE